MKILCFSAANTFKMGKNSTSTRVCALIAKIASEYRAQAAVKEVSLMDQKIKFCMFCGDCADEGLCPYDKDFNTLFNLLKEADICFFVVPHYSPVPAKLLAVFEKINEILYANSIKIPQYASPFLNKRVAIIGHGGTPEDEECLMRYHSNVITPVAGTLMSFGFSIVGLNEKYPFGVPFGLRDGFCIQPREDSVFPDIMQDWNLIENRIRPLVRKVIHE